ncbi:MAG TPA: hypothetical protein P5262_01775 [Candidatus Moranbacteria bacterium]|nr:hypothetical protein [Candidatus Moranbacteria bacterium]
MIKNFITKLIALVLIIEMGWVVFAFFQNNSYVKTINTDAWTAIGTIFLGAVALSTFFYDRYKNRKAKVSMFINTTSPDCHQIELTNSATREFVSNCVYIRIRVSHIKGNSADDAEIIISNFWTIDENGEKKVKKAFLPMNLKWSHFEGKKRSIPRRFFRHCDFGSFRPINSKYTILLLDTAVQPNKVSKGEIPNVIEPGKYEFELMLSGVNTNFIRKRWVLEFDGGWNDDESIMLNKHISIKERKFYNFLLRFFG